MNSKHPDFSFPPSEKPFRLSRDAVKLVAILAMTGNHIAHVFLVPGTFVYEALIGLGYMTAITMCFFLTEGYHASSHPARYAARLFLFGLISQPPYYALFGFPQPNILFTLLLCLILVHIMNQPWARAWQFIAVLSLIVVSGFFEWGFYLPVCAIAFQKCHEGKRDLRSSYLFLIVLYFVMELMEVMNGASVSLSAIGTAALHCVGPALSAVFILHFYQGKSGGRRTALSRWFFYVYYPAHLCVLLAVSRWLLP